jgi:broad specificity phosphatase PhoE
MDDRPSLPRKDRDEAPLYLARYLERQGRSEAEDAEDGDGDIPLYLRQFRKRRSSEPTPQSLPPLFERTGLGMQQALTEDNRNKEIAAPAEAKVKLAADVYLIRHGETQGYSSESGLTPAGTWQAHTYGHTISRRVSAGETLVLRHANTSRARETIQNINRGLSDGLAMFEKDVKVFEPEPMDEFRNFGVATPDGIRDVTGAFRQYYSTLEKFERIALGDRPMWLVEVDRFWQTQLGGGDPIQHWLTVPMFHFEPPAMTVRRFWVGIRRLAEEFPGSRILIATHSGPIRAFAIAALGYDPGEPYNTEHVRVKLEEGGRSALVTYRNRVQEVHVPDIEALPTWELGADWDPTGVREMSK